MPVCPCRGPEQGRNHQQGRLLVFAGWGQENTRQALAGDLAQFLAEQSGRPFETVVVRERGLFLKEARQGADFVLCPDGLALQLDEQKYDPLVAGRRKMPANLRPRGVVVYRLEAGLRRQPWRERPARTVLGDSLSLVATGGVDWSGGGLPCACGPDPYDHGPVLHALRLGAFDYALVRQWDAEAFFADGLLDPQVFGLEMRTDPVPDIVLLADREASMVDRVRWAEDLTLVGVEEQPTTEAGHRLAVSLPALGLSGFSLLLDTDLDRMRKLYGGDWPRPAN